MAKRHWELIYNTERLPGSGEEAQWLKVLGTFAHDLSPVPGTHKEAPIHLQL